MSERSRAVVLRVGHPRWLVLTRHPSMWDVRELLVLRWPYPTLRTSDSDWLPEAVRSYMRRQPFFVVDDANVGVTAAALEHPVDLIRFAVGRVWWWAIVVAVTVLGGHVVGIF